MLEAVQSAPSTTQDRDDGTSLLHLERSIVRHASSAAPRQSSAATLPLALPLASCRSTPVYFGNLDLSPWPRSGVAIAHVDSGRTKPERNGRPRRRCRRELAGNGRGEGVVQHLVVSCRCSTAGDPSPTPWFRVLLTRLGCWSCSCSRRSAAFDWLPAPDPLPCGRRRRRLWTSSPSYPHLLQWRIQRCDIRQKHAQITAFQTCIPIEYRTHGPPQPVHCTEEDKMSSPVHAQV